MIYRPSRIGGFEFAVVAALRAEQLRRGSVPKVEGGHKFVVTAQLEVAAGKVVRAVEGTVQDLPEAVGLTQTPAVLSNDGHRDEQNVARTAAPSAAGLVEAEMTSNCPAVTQEKCREPRSRWQPFCS